MIVRGMGELGEGFVIAPAQNDKHPPADHVPPRPAELVGWKLALTVATLAIVAKTAEKGLEPFLPPLLVGGVAVGVVTWFYSTLRKVTP